ncbi:MAG: hypothetical protein Q9162_006015 [Coniocarpon cinnabarinum]
MQNSASTRSAQLTEKRNELAAVVQSRKRKLCELYAVTTSQDPNPAPITPNSHPADSPISQFLAQNDIESGYYFDESSLPPRPKVEWLPPSPPEEVLDDTAHLDEAEYETAPSPSPKRISRSRIASPQSIGQKDSFSQTPEDGIITQHAEADLPNGSIPTPRSAIEHDDSLDPRAVKPLPQNKAATPHSPPDSPRSQYVDADTSMPDQLPSGTINAQQQDREISSETTVGHKKRQGSAPLPEPGSGAVTSRKLPDTDRARLLAESGPGRGTSLPPAGAPRRGKSKHRISTRTSPRKTPDRLSAIDEDRRNEQHARTAMRRSPVPAFVSHDTRKAVQSSANEEQNKQQSTSDDASKRDPLGSIQDRPTPSKRTLEDAIEVPRVPKAKRLKREKSQLAIKLAKADRYIPALRHNRFAGSQEYRHPGAKKDYMHILFLRQALDSASAFKTDLSNLLASTSKTLTTSDWESNFHEKNECAVVKRVYDLQQRNTWSLRQPKPYPEPARPPSHWDYLLREAKWLQTDFREERKLKLSVCQELAHWCKEWHDASASERTSLQLISNLKITTMNCKSDALEDARSPPQALDAKHSHTASQDNSGDLAEIFDSTGMPNNALGSEELGSELLDRLPLLELWRSKQPLDQDLSISADMQRMADIRQAISADSDGSNDVPPELELPPDEASCAIFDPGWKQLRARVNASVAFKMPTSQMPPMGFYEHRRASQWTPEDDHQLKQYAKDFPSNWALISDRLSSRSQYTPSVNRRTPWECYERLLCMEGVHSDPQMRQYARQFSMTLDRIRARWQQNMQHSMQAQGMAQQLQHSPPRFPAPLRIERKMPSRRFACILNGARKLAQKREERDSTRKHSQSETLSQVPRHMSQPKPDFAHTPQHWSEVKFQKEEQSKRRAMQLKQQQQALAQAQQQNPRQSSQALYNSGLSQRTGSRGAEGPQGAPTANGHLAVPGSNPHRSQASQSALQAPLTNGAQPNNQLAAQLAMGGRPQNTLPMQQRMASGFGNGQQLSDQNLQQMLVAQQQSRQQQQQALQHQRQMSQNNVGRGSPTMGNVNGMPNLSALNQFSGANGDSLQSPRLPHSAQSGSSQTSPSMAHQMMAQLNGQRPHQLSSGHVTVLDSLRHNIAQDNPQLSADEVMNLATSQLQKTMRDQNSVNYAQNRALNAAAGMHQMPQQQQQQPSQSQQRPPTQQGMRNPPQSPYLNTQQSPYLQNSMLANHMAGRSNSPGNPLQQQQQNYTQSMQQQISQQMQRNGVMSPTATAASPTNPASSPPMGSATMMSGMPFANGPARTPTPGQNAMRPPSAAMMDQRPGSANAMAMGAGSPRPVSSQGVQ